MLQVLHHNPDARYRSRGDGCAVKEFIALSMQYNIPMAPAVLDGKSFRVRELRTCRQLLHSVDRAAGCKITRQSLVG